MRRLFPSFCVCGLDSKHIYSWQIHCTCWQNPEWCLAEPWWLSRVLLLLLLLLLPLLVLPSQVVGTVRPEVAELLGLGPEVQVAPGSGDNAMSALGAGITQ